MSIKKYDVDGLDFSGFTPFVFILRHLRIIMNSFPQPVKAKPALIWFFPLTLHKLVPIYCFFLHKIQYSPYSLYWHFFVDNYYHLNREKILGR